MVVLLALGIFVATRLPADKAGKMDINGIVTLAAGIVQCFYVEDMDAAPSVVHPTDRRIYFHYTRNG